LNNWKKVIIGTLLFSGFVFYTQYEKNAEPVWKVDDKEFTVVKTLQEGMNREYSKFEELQLVDKYGLLQEANKTVQLNDELRTLKFEKIWNMQGRLYVLYSVDLKERDKDEREIPRLTIKKMKLSAKDGNEAVFSASENTGIPGTRDEGFVYKHRLYRSMMVVPKIINNDQMDWDLLTKTNRIELQEVEISDKNGVKPIKNMAFKISSENLYLKVLESSSINKQFTYANNKKVKINSYDVLLYDQRFSLDIPNNDKDLVAFSGYMNDQNMPFTWDIIGTESQGYYLPFYGDLAQNENEEKSITFNSSIHKSDQSYAFTISKEVISHFNKNPNQPFIKSEEVFNQNSVKIIYEGLSKYNGGPTIKVSVLTAGDSPNILRFVPESYYGGNDIPEEYKRSFQKNLVTIMNEKNEKLGNFDMLIDETESKTTYYIHFYKEDINDGATNPTPIPEENLTITLSDLVHSKPLSSPVTIKYTVPPLKK
jgi:hypothetical protein